MVLSHTTKNFGGNRRCSHASLAYGFLLHRPVGITSTDFDNIKVLHLWLWRKHLIYLTFHHAKHLEGMLWFSCCRIQLTKGQTVMSTKTQKTWAKRIDRRILSMKQRVPIGFLWIILLCLCFPINGLLGQDVKNFKCVITSERRKRDIH